SAASSGGICSKAWRTASTMRVTGSESASATMASVRVSSFGTPERLSRPLIGIDRPWPCSGALAVPLSFLMRSAVLSPIIRSLRRGQRRPRQRLADELFGHLLGDIEVGDDAVA